MSYHSELDIEQEAMEDDPAYTVWLESLDESFAIETKLWYNINIGERNEL